MQRLAAHLPDAGVGPAPDLAYEVGDVRQSSRGAGLNLALPLARRLVERHGGSLKVASSWPARLTLSVPSRRPTPTSTERAR